MSFRKFNSFSKSEKKTMSVDISVRPFESLIKLFTRNSSDVVHKRNESCSFSTKTSNIVKKPINEFDFLWNLEIVLIYTENLIRQKIDDLNRKNIIQQFLQCAKFIDLHLKESQLYVDNLNASLSSTQDIKKCLEIFQSTYVSFSNWIENVKINDEFDLNIGQDLFLSMQVKAQKFINHLKFGLRDLDKDYKRSSIDNSSLISTGLKSLDSDSSKKSCFNEEDRKLIDKLKKLDKNIDLPPPKPAIPKFEEGTIDSYLNQLEEIIQSRKESEYDYPTTYKNIELKSVKIENNCIMASSIISNDIPPVDMEASDDFTPTPNMTDSLTNGFCFSKDEPDSIPKVISQERSRNFPLPPIPCERKSITRFKLPNFTSHFPSEEIHYRKASIVEDEKSQVTNGIIANFSHRSPLRSPILISSINSQNSKFPPTKLQLALKDCQSSHSILSPSSLSQRTEEGTNFHSINSSRQLLMAKQIPSIVNDPNDLLNINDMQDDIEIITRSFDPFVIEDKILNRISDASNQTNISTQSEPQYENKESSSSLMNNNDAYCNSEVKSDTEEYFEYFEIDGRKYRRKMKKRTVIEKIKIRKTILAPMKPDGSGPDLLGFKGVESSDSFSNNELSASTEDSQIKYNEHPNEIANHPRFRRGNEDRLRVSKSMFYPYRDETKRQTLCNPPNLKTDSNNKLFPLMNKYMYRFGQSNFEEPVIDKRFSTQLTDAVYSTWFKTSESILPHEKSKSICYLKKSREKNEDGATVQNEVRVTASRTIRMKIPDVNQQASTLPYPLSPLAITNYPEEESSIIEGEDSDTSLCDTDTSLCGTDRISDNFDSYIHSSDDEKEDGGNLSDSISSEHEIKQSNRSTIEDPYLHDLNLDEFEESISVKSERSVGSDSLFYSHHSSTISETKDDYSSILEDDNTTQYLIFDEDSKFGECDIAGGPVDALIVYACDGKEHLLFLGAFLDTYRTFIEPEKLISRLIIRYKFYQSKLKHENSKYETEVGQQPTTDYDMPQKKCKHVLSLMLTIIGKLKRDLKEGLFEQIQQFQSYLSDIGECQWVEAISRAIENQMHCMKRDDKFVQRLLQLSNPPLKQVVQKSPSKEFNSPTKHLTVSNNTKPTILSFHSREIAEQMTLLDWSKYRDVELMEILNLKDIVNCNLPGVIEYAKNFENVQYWTQSIFLDPERISERDKNCIKFLRIMKHLQRLKNFSSLIAILLAIQLLPTRRMFSKRVQTKIKEYDDYMKPPRFFGYKEDLKNATSPCIPFLGIFYQDIVMLNIANPPYLDLDEMIKNTDRSNFSSNNNQLLLLNTIKCGPIINFWRSFKQYIFLKNCNKDQDKIRYSIEPNDKILQFLNNFKDSYDEATIQRMIKQFS